MSTIPNDLQRLFAEEPFVRSLAHALLVDEADDIVQQTLLHALQHELVHASGAELPRWRSFEVRRGGKLLLLDSARGEPSGPLTGEIWFEPGSYALATRGDGPQGSASFMIADRAGPPLRIAVH